jgi:intracellular sulfur oxidation DsrE/DsrF family protein
VKKKEHISEEQLNAFVDGELEADEEGRVFNEAERSEELEKRLCQQRKLKELVQYAYRDVPEPTRLRERKPSGRSKLRMAAAAMVLLFVGASMGVLGWNYLGPGGTTPVPAAVAARESFLLHVTSGNPAEMKRALDKAGELLASSSPGSPRNVEVVANEKGLNLLRSDKTRFAREISRLSDESVVFYACSRAIRILEEKGVKVHLVPEANSEYTALERVVMRMQDGWQYIKI